MITINLATLAAAPPFYSTPAVIKEKPCRTCKVPKDLDQFVKNASQKDGYDSECLDCRNKRAKTAYWSKKSARQTTEAKQ